MLSRESPPELSVFLAPLDWRPDPRTSLQPDVLVVHNKNLSVKPLAEPLILAVEVLSPSTRRLDLVEKRAKYEAAGVASYWVLDPDVPSVLALDLVGGRYQVAGAAEGEESVELARPFPVTVRPSALLEPYNW